MNNKSVKYLYQVMCLLLLLSCAPEGESGLNGQILFQDRPLAAAQVEIYLKADKDRSVQPFAVTTTDESGSYQVTLPEGRYFVIGKKRESTDDGRTRMLMAESPDNPHTVVEGVVFVPSFNLREMGREGLLAAGSDTGVSGLISWQGEPVARAFVYVYTETDSGLVGPSYGEAVQVDKDGSFSIDLPEGRYFLVARKRADGSRSGALAPGDMNAHYPGNPVHVKNGERTALGGFPLANVDEETFAQRQTEGLFVKTETQLQGKVTDPEGEAVSGVYVFAYLDSRMVGKPVHMSSATGDDGRFELFLSDGGTYYIGARSAYGGPLEPGEWVGTYDGKADHAVNVARGDKDDLGSITVREFW